MLRRYSGPRKRAGFFWDGMRYLHAWYAYFDDVFAGEDGMYVYRDFAMFIGGFMKISDLNADEKQMLLSALDLAIASCERRGNRSGELQSVKDELAKHAEKYRALKSAVVLTK